MPGKVFVVIPAYNEQGSIVSVIKGLRKGGYNNIVVVDDCSTDNTLELIQKQNVHALHHEVNRGQGAALQTGIGFALKEGADIIVTFDADGQHKVEEIKYLLKPIQEKKADAALGSRFLNSKSNVPFFKKLALKAGIYFTWLTSGIKLTDAHNGFRALSRSAAEKIEITQDRMEHASEIVEQIHKKKIRYIEVPVTILYTEYSKAKGQSPINAVKIGLKILLRKFMK